MKYLLLPFSWLYGLVISCRNIGFDLGLLKSEDVGVPVISVGNMTMGGTGKTPLVEYIVGVCLARGRRVAVVSRGYKRGSKGVVVVSDGQRMLVDSTQAGDEPAQIARKYPKTIVVVGERRVDAARKAVSELKADVIVLDDGFQHRYLRRTLDIVVLDASKNLITLSMIPAGERREPMKSLGRANLIAFSRMDEVQDGNAWSRWLGNKYRAPKIAYQYKLDCIGQAGSEKELAARDLKGRKMILFSGIGDHEGFVRQMSKADIEILDNLKFSDHYSYTQADLKRITDRATKKGADGVLTTEKDFVRLSGNRSVFVEFVKHTPLFYAGIVVDIVEGRVVLHSMIEKCLTGSAV